VLGYCLAEIADAYFVVFKSKINMENNPKQDAIRPAYYQLEVKGVKFDVFDLVRAIQKKVDFSFELATAIKYIIRLKEDSIEKRINDLEKAKECIEREILFLKDIKQKSESF
jgi:hypothetical protein